jgi:uncharacterized protein
MTEVERPAASPCVRVCKFNEFSQCYGCFRSICEVRAWNQLDARDQSDVRALLADRRESYWLSRSAPAQATP